MKSTGEAIGIDSSFDKALYKSLLSSNTDPLKHHSVVISCNRETHDQILESAQLLDKVGYKIYATDQTAKYLSDNNIDTIKINKLHHDNNILDLLVNENISFIINIPSMKMQSRNDLLEMRKLATTKGITIISSPNLALTIAKLCSNMKYLIKSL